MKNNYEYHFFLEELSKLHCEYHRCHDVTIRKEISKDIELLEKAINTL